MIVEESLWGEEFNIEIPDKKERTKKILNKIAKPKELSTEEEVVKQVKSKKLSLEERLVLIEDNVNRILGKRKDETLLIYTKEELHDYISKALENKIIAIDTETNNSLDPITCKLMGGCIYTPGLKQAYIPINHRDYKTRLPNQLTENDLSQEFQRIVDSDIITIFHNGKFDYQVIKCTCGIELPIKWDTMIGAKLLDENEKSAGLKQQYIDKIDPNQEKYDIDHLFENVEYADVAPEIFSLYAATDAKLTYDLYEWQMERFKDPDLSRVLNLAETIEMPLVIVVAEMELNGVEFDSEYDERLSVKYHRKLDELDERIDQELVRIKDKIDAWRLTPDAKATKVMDESGKISKSKNEQLTDPINLASPVQLAILLYDILKAPIVDKKKPRATGEDALKAIADKMKLHLAELLLERRGLVKLITSFIDSLPSWVNPKTGRIHCHFNAYGAATGRFSSSEPNLQQIPSSNHELRLLFKAGKTDTEIDCSGDEIICEPSTELLTSDGYIESKVLKPGHILLLDTKDGEQQAIVRSVEHTDSKCIVKF